jgi:transposase-like protein
MNLTSYSTNIKRTAVEKILGPSRIPVSEVSEEMGINKRTLYGWLKKSRNGDMNVNKRRSNNHKIRFQEKYRAVLEYKRLSEENLGKWLREKGYREDQIKLWEKEIETALDKIDTEPSGEIEKELRELKKELLRKDKALAEVSALLILKKKLNILMGVEEDSEK